MYKYLLSGAVAAVMVASSPAIAQMPAPAPGAPVVQNQVLHGRATVQTRAAVAAHVRAMFDRLDSNRDGSIIKAEAEAAKASHGDRAGRHMPGGAMAGRRGMFDRMDANHDGNISRAEFDAMPMHRAHDMAMGAGGNSDGMMMKHGGKMGGMGGRMFDMADANHDGRVTMQEATNAALRHFDMADVNRDGQLTPDERMQMHQRMRAERKPG